MPALLIKYFISAFHNGIVTRQIQFHTSEYYSMPLNNFRQKDNSHVQPLIMKRRLSCVNSGASPRCSSVNFTSQSTHPDALFCRIETISTAIAQLPSTISFPRLKSLSCRPLPGDRGGFACFRLISRFRAIFAICSQYAYRALKACAERDIATQAKAMLNSQDTLWSY